jgi:hypothetical protein
LPVGTTPERYASLVAVANYYALRGWYIGPGGYIVDASGRRLSVPTVGGATGVGPGGAGGGGGGAGAGVGAGAAI